MLAMFWRMTLQTILRNMTDAGKPVHLVHLHRLLKALWIKPLGRSRPQNYPEDTATRVLEHLGITPAALPQRQSIQSALADLGLKPRTSKLVTAAQLRAAKPSKKKGTK